MYRHSFESTEQRANHITRHGRSLSRDQQWSTKILVIRATKTKLDHPQPPIAGAPYSLSEQVDKNSYIDKKNLSPQHEFSTGMLRGERFLIFHNDSITNAEKEHEM